MTEKLAITNMSPIRQIWVISAVAVLSSFTLTGAFYYSYYGVDDRFWEAMAMALIVPWGIAIPISWYMIRQRQKLVDLTGQLRQTEEELLRVNSALAHKASYDAMTNMLNRDAFFERLAEIRSPDKPHILMIVDVDHFKKINDSFGHLTGDQALILLADAFRRILRKNDMIGRIGGEEFGIFLPDTSAIEGQVIAEIIRHEIESTVFEPHPGFRHVITVSIGIADASAEHDQSNVMRNADNALFAAKNSGRNQVVQFEPGMRGKPRPVFSAAQSARADGQIDNQKTATSL
ncbi:MAG: GGDEF domain-containing protein [Pseudomonadota bacterium]